MDSLLSPVSFPRQEAEMADLLWQEALHPGRELPATAELEEEIESFRERHEDPRIMEAELDSTTSTELFELP
ncbi:hypothetical protein LUX12_21520 [Streptomyces somaliensis]|uniref:hypothetical protein n=1 Tax=Streptomyces somaliensis TaxID=78355 RepID=UPI0020CCC55F|nr:hypothetical protein [Streptomyces somaliensis]MCP9946791.1 hypothetical protein [Streptomyces somaliensis]MCP9963424.1 hypothetical protein [Streptomyces somaliensis]